MRGPVLIGAAGLLVFAAWRLYQAQQQGEAVEWGGEDWLSDAGGVLGDVGQGAAELLDTVTMGTFRLSNMARVTGADVGHPNVQAFLRVIRRGEGTSDPDGYRRHFGGSHFDSYADHPRKVITATMKGKTLRSSAAGAYQALTSTWDETRPLMKLPDFSPPSQDRFAVGRIAARGALEDVKAGRFDQAINKVAREWASMPGSPYGQPVISMTTARAVYADAGGVFA